MKKCAIMPTRLTAENGAKALLSGEFFESIEVQNPDYCGCGECDFCREFPDEEPTVVQSVPVSWTNIKDIYAKCVKELNQEHRGDEVVVVQASRWTLHRKYMRRVLRKLFKKESQLSDCQRELREIKHAHKNLWGLRDFAYFLSGINRMDRW